MGILEKFAYFFFRAILFRNSLEGDMSRDYRSIEEKRCYTCIQWEGHRTWDSKTKLVSVNEKSDENCLALHKKVRGDSLCERFFPIH